jgi:hypothetical protein
MPFDLIPYPTCKGLKIISLGSVVPRIEDGLQCCTECGTIFIVQAQLSSEGEPTREGEARRPTVGAEFPSWWLRSCRVAAMLSDSSPPPTSATQCGVGVVQRCNHTRLALEPGAKLVVRNLDGDGAA